MPPLKLGAMQTVDIATGRVVAKTDGAFTLLPPPPNLCQECAHDHGPQDPHNQQSLYYRTHFHARHGRPPTWSDAMAHCTQTMRAVWRRHLVTAMKRHNLDIPEDLL